MKALLALAVLAVTQAHAADEWFRESKRTMPELVAAGFQVVALSVNEEKNRFMDLTAYRYVLQKGAEVYICTEKVGGDKTVRATCYGLSE